MSEQMPMTAARWDLCETVDRVKHDGTRIVLTKYGKPQAVIVPLEDFNTLESKERQS